MSLEDFKKLDCEKALVAIYEQNRTLYKKYNSTRDALGVSLLLHGVNFFLWLVLYFNG